MDYNSHFNPLTPQGSPILGAVTSSSALGAGVGYPHLNPSPHSPTGSPTSMLFNNSHLPGHPSANICPLSGSPRQQQLMMNDAYHHNTEMGFADGSFQLNTTFAKDHSSLYTPLQHQPLQTDTSSLGGGLAYPYNTQAYNPLMAAQPQHIPLHDQRQQQIHEHHQQQQQQQQQYEYEQQQLLLQQQQLEQQQLQQQQQQQQQQLEEEQEQQQQQQAAPQPQPKRRGRPPKQKVEEQPQQQQDDDTTTTTATATTTSLNTRPKRASAAASLATTTAAAATTITTTAAEKKKRGVGKDNSTTTTTTTTSTAGSKDSNPKKRTGRQQITAVESEESEEENSDNGGGDKMDDGSTRKEKLAKKAERARILRRERLDRLSELEIENGQFRTTIVEYELTIAQQKLLINAFQARVDQLDMKLLYYAHKYPGALDDADYAQFLTQYEQKKKECAAHFKAEKKKEGGEQEEEEEDDEEKEDQKEQKNTMNDDENDNKDKKRSDTQPLIAPTTTTTMSSSNSSSSSSAENPQQSPPSHVNEADNTSYVYLKRHEIEKTEQQSTMVADELNKELANTTNTDLSKTMSKKLALHEQQQQQIAQQRQEQATAGLLGQYDKNKLNVNNISVHNLTIHQHPEGNAGLDHEQIINQYHHQQQQQQQQQQPHYPHPRPYPDHSTVTLEEHFNREHKPGLKCPNGNKLLLNPQDRAEFEVLHVLRAELTASAERLLHAITVVNDGIAKHADNLHKK